MQDSDYSENREKISLPMVGIVIPAFNVEKYIGECIESLLRQTYKNIAIAIVNDGSTDNTWNIIQKYAADNPSAIRGINSDNRGFMQARFICINRLDDCDYILFVDADDYLIDNAIIEKCVGYMKNADMVCFNMVRSGKPCFKQDGIRHMDRKDGIKNMLSREFFDGNLCGSCFKYGYVNKYFRVMECNNDDYMNKAAFINACEKITVIPDVGYYYRVNTESQTQRKIREADYLYYRHVCEFCKDLLLQYPEFKIETEYFESWVLLWLASGLQKSRELKYLEIYGIVMDEFSKRSKEYLLNKYFKAKERVTYLCIQLHIFRSLYRIYHRL